MNEKRYAIVRVECPPKNEIDAQFVCFPSDNNCSGCRYGDTKEQLIRKVAQAIKRKLKGGLILRNTKINETYNLQKTISAKAVAKEIVEFLGVEE